MENKKTNFISSVRGQIKENKSYKKAVGRFDKLCGKWSISHLTKREKKYVRLMAAKAGVLNLRSAPGKAKSALLKEIADKMNWLFIDLRLAQIDETDVGLYPHKKKLTYVVDTISGEKVEKEDFFLGHVIPEWALYANEPQLVDKDYTGTLIVFEELNRAPITVRNAALQLLNERTIGFNGFKFNDNVFMSATGNLGDADGTEVDELDTALRDRLIDVEHDMPFEEWRDTWASKKVNVHPAIIDFIEINRDQYYVEPNLEKVDDNKTPTPRSWTNLSKMINENFGFRDENNKIVDHAPVEQEIVQFVT